MASEAIPVRVAVRIRPLSTKELAAGCKTVPDLVSGRPQVTLRNCDKSFTYDFAYGRDSNQSQIYNTSVRPLVDQLFRGYNATVLAYGQTGSGKTYSMGTNNRENDTSLNLEGVIPRAVRDIFGRIDAAKSQYDFCVRVAFVELYKEQLYDLLSARSKKKDECIVDLREDPIKGVVIANLTEVNVDDLDDTMKQLEVGSIKRVTAATAMNNTSSRSHAIFTITIEGVRKSSDHMAMDVSSDDEESKLNNLLAKFHLVDLAGSERAKKTKATGERYKEGVAINLGLLALGNVISALGDDSGPKNHIPYRDSKLTRLLQDSLGGNSHTLMIACVSPADSNIEETVSTLRYADRARKIKNKPIVNRDGKDAEIAKLRNEIKELRGQVNQYGSQYGSAGISSKEHKELQLRHSQLASENRELTAALVSCQDELAHMNEKVLLCESSNEQLKNKMAELAAEAQSLLERTTVKEDVEILLKKIHSVREVQKSGDKILADHDMSRFDTTHNNTNADSSTEEEEEEDMEEEYGAAHALKQNALATQLSNLNKVLAQKEQLAFTMTVNDEKIKEVRSQYEEQLTCMEQELKHLQKEKDELVVKTKHVDPTCKISEQRRKRIQELEQSIGDLKKKVVEQQRVIKMNEKNEAKVKQLGEEIRGMKQIKVKLIRQMKEDAEKVRTWKMQKEREVLKLKQTERKQQVQLAKMETLHTKQQNVLRRKMEEAVAANKRLKDVIDKQKAAKKVGGIKGTGLAGAAERMHNLVSQELEVVCSVKEAKQSREQLLRDRKTLTKQLADLRKQSRNTLTGAEREEIAASTKELQADLELRNAQIQDLQKQIMHVDQEGEKADRDGQWWDALASMTEAKIALQYLFEKAAEHMVELSANKSSKDELKQLYEEAIKNTNNLEEEIGQLKMEHGNEMVKAGKEYEEKVDILLSKLASRCRGEQGGYDIQDAELQKFSKLHEELMKMATENELQRQQESNNKKNNKSGNKAKDQEEKRYTAEEFFKQESEEEEGSDEEEGLSDDDPDWYQTPLFRRIKKIRETTFLNKAGGSKRKLLDDDANDLDDDNNVAPRVKKRSNSNFGVGCSCKTGCKNRRCQCRKGDARCGEHCKCPVGECCNRDNSPPQDSILSDKTNTSANNTACTMSLLNDTFDVPDIKMTHKNTPPSITVTDDASFRTPRKLERRTIFKSPLQEEQENIMDSSPPMKTSIFKSPF